MSSVSLRVVRAAGLPATAETAPRALARVLARPVSTRIVAAVIVIAVVAIRFAHFALPTGVDGGNWLALTAELRGVHARAATVAYPPLFLALNLVSQLVLGPLDGLRASAVAVSFLPGLATYLLLRAMGLRALAPAGFTLSFSAYAMDMLSWGGYPQLLGSGLILGSLAAFVHAERSARRRYLFVAGALGGLAILAEQLTGLQAVSGLAVAYVVSGAARRPGWRRFLADGFILGCTAAVVALPGLPMYLKLHGGVRAAEVFNSQGDQSLLELAMHTIQEFPAVWGCMLMCAFAALYVLARRGDWLNLATLIGLLGASIGLALLTFELRFFYLAQAAAVIGSVIFLEYLAAGPQSAPSSRALKVGVRTFACLLFVVVGVLGLMNYYRWDRSYYRVLNGDVVNGLQWLAHERREGDLAASAAAWPNRPLGRWAIGWWVEGLGRVPTYVEVDQRWVFFAQEADQAQTASAIFSEEDPRLAADEARRHGIALLVIDKRDNPRADQWLASGLLPGELELVYSNPSLAIFRVAQSEVHE